MAKESQSVMPYNAVNPSRAPMDRGIHLTEIDTAVAAHFTKVIHGNKIKSSSVQVLSPHLL